MEALQEGHVQAATLLIDAGMRIEAEEGCKSPLMAAVLGGCTEIVANMINTGNKADVNSVFQDGDGYRTALSYASKPEIVRMLLDAKADVNPKGCASVIHEACTAFQPESVKMLLDAGAHPYEEIRSACSPYMRTLMFKCTEETADAKLAVVNLLLAAGVGTDRTSYYCASVAEDPCMERVLDVMLQYIPRLLECVNANGMTPLDHAVENKQLRKVQYLVAAGADVNYWKCTKNGKSLLFPLLSDPDACPRTRAILRVLLDAGVDLGGGDVTNKLALAGQTVFMAAVSAEDRDDWVSATFIRDMAEAVLKRGAFVAL
jgi:ankyrin repeat protein